MLIQKIKKFSLAFGLACLVTVLILPQVKAQYSSHFISRNQVIAAQTEESEKSFNQLIEGSEKQEGLFTLYHHPDTGQVYLELYPEQLNKNYLCFTILESGVGESGLIGGVQLEDFLFQWQMRQNKVEFVLPNINFRTQPDDPQSRSVDRSFSQSVLYSFPIASIHPQRQTALIDLGTLLTSDQDLSGIAQKLSSIFDASYSVDADKSYVSDVKVFPANVEIESVIGFSGGDVYIDSLPDSRSFNLKVRYSFLEVPQNHYHPRLADERLGYFITSYKNLSETHPDAQFVRYINRWHLEKQNPSDPLSPPVKPIVFWIENTVPYEYREAIREGVLMWNKAFKKAGFIDALQVKQMPDDATWDPADARYNTIRWSTSFRPTFNGYGPSHVNPLNGQILDADIVLESNSIKTLQDDAEVILNHQLDAYSKSKLYSSSCWSKLHSRNQKRHSETEHLCFQSELNHQLSVGATALSLLENIPLEGDKMKAYIHQYLRALTAHEIGHALGLRHNFHGSTLLPSEKLNNTQITRTQGLSGSVMDYLPVNLAPNGQPQGDYFPVIVGPYDDWVIEYGYTPMAAASPMAEKSLLEPIARRSSQPELSYATDEDMRGIYLDPAANIYDLSQDMLQYSQWQLDNARLMWQRLENYSPPQAQGYDRVRRMFNTVLYYYLKHADHLTLYVGGQSFNRSRAGDPDGRLPFEPISIDQQRQALQILQQYIFAEDAFNFSPELLNQLAPSRWSDWGNPELNYSLEYPIGEQILRVQRWILWELFDSTRLTRLRDSELKAKAHKVLTLPELFETVQNGIWIEILNSNPSLSISSTRRALQREHLDLLSEITLRQITVPEDAHTLAEYQLKQLNKTITQVIQKHRDQMDAYTLAHLEVSRDRIFKTLNAQIQSD